MFRHFSLITDTNLNETELFYLRWIHDKIGCDRAKDEGEIILPHLWSAYGTTFEDKSLLYATLCFALYRHRGRFFSSSLDDEIKSRFLSLCHNSLLDAITANTISECHLFATFLLMECYKFSDSEYKAHQEGFVAILKFLLENKDKLPQTDFRVQYLHYFMCNSTVTWRSRRVGTAWTLLDHIPVPDRDYEPRVLEMLPPSFWRRTRNGLPASGSIVWSISASTLRRMWHEFDAILLAFDANDISVIVSDERMDSLVCAKRYFEDAIAIPSVGDFLKAVLPRNLAHN